MDLRGKSRSKHLAALLSAGIIKLDVAKQMTSALTKHLTWCCDNQLMCAVQQPFTDSSFL